MLTDLKCATAWNVHRLNLKVAQLRGVQLDCSLSSVPVKATVTADLMNDLLQREHNVAFLSA